MHWTVESPTGTGSSLKQLILTVNSTDVKLKFFDAQAFFASGTLIVLAKDFQNTLLRNIKRGKIHNLSLVGVVRTKL